MLGIKKTITSQFHALLKHLDNLKINMYSNIHNPSSPHMHFLQVETPIKNLCCFNELMYSTIVVSFLTYGVRKHRAESSVN